MLLLLPTLSLAVYLSIDPGTAYTKSSVAHGGEYVEVGKNSLDQKSTPTFIGFRARSGFNPKSFDPIKPEETQLLTPHIGYKAIEIINTRPYMGLGYFPDFYGLDESVWEERAKSFYTGMNASRVSFFDCNALFYKMYASSIVSTDHVEAAAVIISANNIHNQRFNFEFALQVAGYKNLQLIEDTDAMSYVYANEKSNKFSHGSRRVLFVDIGAASVKAYVIRFYQTLSASGRMSLPAAERLSYVIDYQTGGIFLTKSIINFIKNKTRIRQEPTEAENFRLFMGAEKLKIQISSNDEATTVISEIRGLDRTVTLTRPEFEEIVQPYVQDVINVVKNASDGIPYDEIELIGGGSHDMAFYNGIKNATQARVLKTFDPDNALAKGGAYGLQFSNDVSRYQTVKVNYSRALMNLTLTTLVNTYPLCVKDGQCKYLQKITGDSQAIMFDYDKNLTRPGLKSSSFGYFVDVVKEPIILRFSQTPYDLLDIQNCNKTGCHHLGLTPLMPPDGPSEIFTLFAEDDKNEDRIKELKKEILDLCNKTLYDVQKNKTFRYFSNYNQRLEIIRAAERSKQYVEDYGEVIDSVANLTSTLMKLKDIVDPVIERISANTSLVRSANMFMQTIQMIQNTTRDEWPVNKTFLDRRTVKRFAEIFNETMQWYKDSIQLVRNSPPYLPRPVVPNDYDDRGMKLYNYFRKVDELERMKKRTGYKYTPEEMAQRKKDDIEDEFHNLEYEYEYMTDDEHQAVYDKEEWKDPFIELDNEQKEATKTKLQDFQFSNETLHYIRRKSRQIEQAERKEKARKKEERRRKAMEEQRRLHRENPEFFKQNPDFINEDQIPDSIDDHDEGKPENQPKDQETTQQNENTFGDDDQKPKVESEL